MTTGKYHCSDCGTEIAGGSRYCVLCYCRRHQPCPDCMRRTPGGSWRPHNKPGTSVPIDCPRCNNERYILS